ncbi:unnamed protein product [Bursaphelenchus xylophilus]|uniref:(pine wood nematode) hypothetical protein n=1 Tax=Bursaphelenchus xylophilus TaxID=6326 RepID=A0A1I7SC33_BURXY|nr:unnamed protein product [Bursaphelenchus xylophilus]CAG9086465.1 unnamed protein product [Bursaphelenchus xylophilus]
MSLLCVTIKRAQLHGTAEEFHSYVTVKLQNVKSTTVAVRGPKPSWEQEFIFETNRLDQGLMVELWNKGVLWDKLIGVHYLPLYQVQYRAGPGPGVWLQIDQELETRNGQTVGTCKPTGHSVMVDVRFELPFEAQSADAEEVQRRLQELNRFVENEGQISQRAPFSHSGVSEDSDYTSDVSFPIHQNNQSVHQWGSHLHPSNVASTNSCTIQNPPFEEEFDGHPEDVLSVSTNFQNTQEYQENTYGLSNYSEPYNYELDRQSPHGLRRFHLNPAENLEEESYGNGQIYQSGYYDAYMHSIPEDEYKGEDNEGNVYSEDGAYPTGSSVERTSGEEYNTTPSFPDASLHHLPQPSTPDYTKPEGMNGGFDIHQQIYNEYAQYDDTGLQPYPEEIPEEFDAELEDIEPTYMDRQDPGRRGLRRVQVQGEYGYDSHEEPGTSEYPQEDYSGQNYDSPKEYEQSLDKGFQGEDHQFEEVNRQYDSGQEYGTTRQYDSGKEFEVIHRQYDSGNQINDIHYEEQYGEDQGEHYEGPRAYEEKNYGEYEPNQEFVEGQTYDQPNDYHEQTYQPHEYEENEYQQYNDTDYSHDTYVDNTQYVSDHSEQKSEYGSIKYQSHDEQTRPSSSGERIGYSNATSPLAVAEVQDYMAQLAATGRRYDSKPDEYDFPAYVEVEHNQAYNEYGDKTRPYSQQNTDDEHLSYSSRPISQINQVKEPKSTGNGFLPNHQPANDADLLRGIYAEEEEGHDQQVPDVYEHEHERNYQQGQMEGNNEGREQNGLIRENQPFDEYGVPIREEVDEFGRVVEDRDEFGRVVDGRDQLRENGEYREEERQPKPPRNYRDLWRLAYQKICEKHGIEVGDVIRKL